MKKRSMMLLVLAAACAFSAAAADQPASWFTATKAAEGVWTISDNGADNMYLVEGSEKALLIDTGLGTADLKRFVGTLTTKPVVVVNTHGHPDHAGGNFQFAEVYAHPADFDSIRRLGSAESRKQSAGMMARGTPGPDMISPEEAAKAPEAKLVAVKAGYMFDLGGRRLEVIESAGHTPGEIVLLDAANRIIFTGDNSNTLVWLFLANSLPLETYLESLKSLNARVSEFDTIYPGHGTPLPATFISEQVACVEGILDGSIKGEPQKSFAGESLVGRYKSAAVAYSPGNLRATE